MRRQVRRGSAAASAAAAAAAGKLPRPRQGLVIPKQHLLHTHQTALLEALKPLPRPETHASTPRRPNAGGGRFLGSSFPGPSLFRRALLCLPLLLPALVGAASARGLLPQRSEFSSSGFTSRHDELEARPGACAYFLCACSTREAPKRLFGGALGTPQRRRQVAAARQLAELKRVHAHTRPRKMKHGSFISPAQTLKSPWASRGVAQRAPRSHRTARTRQRLNPARLSLRSRFALLPAPPHPPDKTSITRPLYFLLHSESPRTDRDTPPPSYPFPSFTSLTSVSLGVLLKKPGILRRRGRPE